MCWPERQPPRHRCSQRHRLAGFSISLCVLLSSTVIEAQPLPSPHAMKEDAELTDIVFLDADTGWAVGDRGVIWKTQDGGRRWEVRNASVTCRLESICFVNDTHGWIVGGWPHAYTHKNTGVVLKTVNGGQTWNRVNQPTLPALKHVQFFDKQRGWAVGNASAMYPSGIFQTNDGGRTWTPLPSGRGAVWLTADFRSPYVGAVAGHQGNLGLILNKEIQPSRTPNLGSRNLHAMRLERGIGWLVGESGLLMRSSDGGLTWQRPPGALPAGINTRCDFYTVAAIGSHVWVAGAPGSVVLYSSDKGATWTLQQTGQSLPIRSLHFSDERIGYAVGALGTILSTRDGGQTWQTQRSGGTRVALLGIFSDPTQIPYEVFAQTSANDGYLSAVETITRRVTDTTVNAETPTSERNHHALVAAGGSVASSTSQFPVMQRELHLGREEIVRGWDTMTDGRGLESLLEHLVLKIRQWQPDVVLSERSQAGGDALGGIVHQITRSACERAGDPTSFPDHLTSLNLSAWAPKRLYLCPAKEGAETVSITTTQLATRLGQSLTEYASSARGVIHTEYSLPEPMLGLQLVHSTLPQTKRGLLFSGILLQPGGEARRQIGPPKGNLQQLTRASHKRRNMEQLIANHAKTDALNAAWLGEIDDLTEGMTTHGAGDILHQLAVRYHNSGRSEMAAEVFQRLIQQYPKHDLAEAAMLWLVRYYSSGEVAWRRQRAEKVETHLLQPRQSAQVQQATGAELLRTREERPRATIAANYGLQRWRSSGDPQLDALNSNHRSSLALNIGTHVQKTRPGLYSDPRLRMPLVAAARRDGNTRSAEQYLRKLAAPHTNTPWTLCARNEIWISHAQGLAPKTTHACPLVPRPHLDGLLNEPTWQGATPLQLTSSLHDDTAWEARAFVARDEKYLYLAATCRRAPGVAYPETNLPRPRDPALDKEDRVTFLIDIDRDYGSFYELTIDHRGWVAESCFQDASWNPTWYVAADRNAESWTVEAAIPLDELVPDGKVSQTAWVFGAQRVVPGVGFQSWTKPAAIQPVPQGLGVLILK